MNTEKQTWSQMAEDAAEAAKQARAVANSQDADPIWSEYVAQMAEAKAKTYSDRADKDALVDYCREILVKSAEVQIEIIFREEIPFTVNIQN